MELYLLFFKALCDPNITFINNRIMIYMKLLKSKLILFYQMCIKVLKLCNYYYNFVGFYKTLYKNSPFYGINKSKNYMNTVKSKLHSWGAKNGREAYSLWRTNPIFFGRRTVHGMCNRVHRLHCTRLKLLQKIIYSRFLQY